ncbi:UvrD-helicase domain-containing protein [Lentisphaerota bacterium WC36G]|nr:UvrD-helicase domain-containing protein [Lentisphaerae bacterium WC36]
MNNLKNSHQLINEFDFLSHDFCLGDKLLIEASAGTGKTFNIENIVLKLIIEGIKSSHHNNKNSQQTSSKEVVISEVLIVTFTDLATAELCARIRENIQNALNFVLGIDDNYQHIKQNQEQLYCNSLEQFILNFIEFGYSYNKDLKQYNIERKNVLLNRLNHALYTFDEASICTIHSFCQKMLKEFSVDSNQLFNSELVDSAEIIERIVYQFFRDNLYSQDSTLLNVVCDIKKLNYEYFSSVAKTFDQHAIRDFSDNGDFDNLKKNIDIIQQSINNKIELLVKIFSEISTDFYHHCDFELHDCYKKFAEDFPNNLATLRTNLSNNNLSGILCQLGYFSEKFIFKKLLKAKQKCWQPNMHARQFFDLCVSIPDEVDKLADYFIRYFANYFLEKYQDEINSRPIITYNELLQKLHNALENSQKLVDNIRKKYTMALIDEFQDTDSIQYQIFAKIFDNPQNLLIMVGDPKQAIYGFRGADIFTYLRVAKNLDEDQKTTLVKNFRTSQNLLNAINCLFEKELPFAIDNIDFVDATAGKVSDEVVIDNENIMQQPLKIFQPADCVNFKFNKDNYRNFSCQVTAKKIAEILQKANQIDSISKLPLAHINGRKIVPADIAVLVRNANEAEMISQRLLKYNIASVKQGNDNIFVGDEARELLKLLTAILNPQNSRAVMSALSLSYFNFDFSDIYQLNYDEKFAKIYEGIIEVLIYYRNIWQNFSFIKMINSLKNLHISSILGTQFDELITEKNSLLYKLEKNNLKMNLLNSENGNRKMTNFNHLVEILHQEEKKHNLQPVALLNHLANFVRNPEANAEYELRLESDSQAVQILTMHKSKGLQFGIVFCPFVWGDSSNNQQASKEKAIIYHDANNQQHISLTNNELSEAKNYYKFERLADELRLFYVAVTRAKYGCYLVWADKQYNKTRAMSFNSPMDYLYYNFNKNRLHEFFNSPTLKNLQLCLESNNSATLIDEIDKKFKYQTDRREQWQDHQNIEFITVDEKDLSLDFKPSEQNDFFEKNKVDEYHFIEFSGKIAKDFRVLSFSNLNSNLPHLTENVESGDVNDDDKLNNENDNIVDRNLRGINEEHGVNDKLTPSILGDFPKGTFSGDCIHDLFEKLDFDYFKEQNIDNLKINSESHVGKFIHMLLKKYGRLKYDVATQEESYQKELELRLLQLVKMFKNTVSSRMYILNNSLKKDNSIVLENLHSEAMVCEMPFFFKTPKSFNAENLLSLSRKAFDVSDSTSNFEDQLENRKEQLRGFMNGKIDLIFEHDDKFFIIDWKSSYLGDFNENYNIDAIKKDMFEKNYYLQAAIYTVALKAFLSNKIANFNFEKQFGGVLYLYVRGIDQQLNTGVWSMNPDTNVIEQIANLLGVNE